MKKLRSEKLRADFLFPIYFVGYQPFLWGFGASFCKMGGLIAKPPILSQTLSFVGGSESLGI